MRWIYPVLSTAVLFLACPDAVHAHGGAYRGPPDSIPPSAGGGGGTGGPTTPGGAGGGGGRPGTGGTSITDDLSKWQYWWGFNKDPFIKLKEAIHKGGIQTGSEDIFMGPSRRQADAKTSKPSETDILESILPALKRALDSTDNRDITSACVVAMAKIGRNHPRFKILPIFKTTLVSFDQEIRETAAIAMGISQMEDAIQPLRHLVLDDRDGRKLVEKASVDDRTRSFAAYGMGLIAHASKDAGIKQTTLAAMATILRDDSIADRNIRVAAINTIALLNTRSESDDGSNAALDSVLDKALQELDTFYKKKLGRGEQMIQAHVPPAVAKLLGRGNDDRHRTYKELYHQELTSGKRRANDIYRSAAIVLGQLAEPAETNEKDAKYSKALLDYFRTGRDRQARYFALVSLGQIGGAANRTELLTILRRGRKALERPWAALALGIYCFDIFEQDPDAVVDDTVGKALLKQFREVRNPQTRAAFAIALGLARYREAAQDLLATLIAKKHQDQFAGFLSLGLALMDYTPARSQIHEVVRGAVRRPGLLKQSAIALGKLGDRTVTDTLTEMLGESTNLAKLSAIAGALNYIGDRRTIKPLVRMLFDEDLTDLTRAFAAVALGGVADKEPLPWNSKIALNMDYRAAVETLTQSGRGILDIF